jgi:hypothetical protein
MQSMQQSMDAPYLKDSEKTEVERMLKNPNIGETFYEPFLNPNNQFTASLSHAWKHLLLCTCEIYQRAKQYSINQPERYLSSHIDRRDFFMQDREVAQVFSQREYWMNTHILQDILYREEEMRIAELQSACFTQGVNLLMKYPSYSLHNCDSISTRIARPVLVHGTRTKPTYDTYSYERANGIIFLPDGSSRVISRVLQGTRLSFWSTANGKLCSVASDTFHRSKN